MALNYTGIKIIKDILTIIKDKNKKIASNNINIKVACLSYPDIIVSEEDIRSVFNNIFFLKKEIDSDQIKKWHGILDKFEIVDTDFFFRALNFDTDYFDIRKIRKNEIILNLNEELPKNMEKNYDLVIDAGTLEHCFNVGLAFINMLKLLKSDGIVMSCSPINYPNHGFWSFSPCVYENFFRENSWRMLFYLATDNTNKIIDINDLNSKNFNAPKRSIQYVVAQRVKESTFKYPLQHKYKKYPDLKFK